MAKHNCAICGAEVGLMSGQKLADGNYICRKVCRKKTLKYFDCVPATLDDVTSHIAQVEKGTKIWNELLLPLKKSKNKDEKLNLGCSAVRQRCRRSSNYRNRQEEIFCKIKPHLKVKGR